MTIKGNGGIFGRNPTFNNVTVDGTLTVDQIVEKTGAAGITLDGVTLKDGNVVLAAGKGIDFSATSGTGTSELFDDYEEGTWTPALARSGGGLTYTPGASDIGYYTKIGNLVSVHLIISGTFSGGSGGYQVTGLPFTVAATPYSMSTGLFADLSTGGAPSLTAIATSSATTAGIFGTPSSGNVIVCSFAYRT